MSLAPTEEQELLRESARGFLDEQAPISELRRLRDSLDPVGFSRDVWKAMAELGWAGIPFEERFGGAGLGMAELGVVMQECGRTLAASPLLASTGLGGALVTLGGSDAQRERWLAPLCAGDLVLTGAVQEGAHHAPHRVATRAERRGGEFVLRGRKQLVLDGHVADAMVVVARTSGGESERGGLGLFVVDAGARGLSVARTVLIDGRNAANVELDGVAVPADCLLGDADGGADALDAALDRATAALCAEMLGGLEAAFAKTLAYLKVREQFGVPIGSFQALKHRAAKMYIEVELAKSLALDALRAIDEGRADAPAIVSAAKAKMDDAAQLVGNESVQMHGGIGVTDEEDIGLYLKRFRVQQRTFGDGGFHRRRYAELRGY